MCAARSFGRLQHQRGAAAGGAPGAVPHLAEASEHGTRRSSSQDAGNELLGKRPFDWAMDLDVPFSIWDLDGC